MEHVKFTAVKLIILNIALICSIHLIQVRHTNAKEIFAIQIAASKTPVNTLKFSKKYNITDSIRVIKSEFWYRYYIGNFDTYEMASSYALQLTRKTKLKNVFVNPVDDVLYNKNYINIADTAGMSDSLIDASLISNPVQSETELANKSSSGISNIKKETSSISFSDKFILRLFLADSDIETLHKKLINYGKENFSQSFYGIYSVLIDNIFRYSIILVLVVFILFFILNIIVVFLLLHFTIKRKSRKEKFLKIFGKMYESVIMSYLFGEIDWQTACVKLKRIEKKENRKLLVSILLNFKENFKGDMEKFIPEIFINLGLQNDSLKAANSSHTYRKVQGIIELTHLYPQGAKEIIQNLINHKNDYVRSEAQIAFISLNQDEPFKFFETLSRPFTRWTQLSAFNLVRMYQLNVPSFAQYLDNKNLSVRNFSLQMIVYFQQLENIPGIIRMLNSEIEQTRFLSYRAINNLRIYEGRELIKNKYWGETGKNKLEIVKAFRNIGMEEDFGFLEKIVLSETVSLKVEACRSLYFMSNEGRQELIKMRNAGGTEIGLLLEQVTDPRN